MRKARTQGEENMKDIEFFYQIHIDMWTWLAENHDKDMEAFVHQYTKISPEFRRSLLSFDSNPACLYAVQQPEVCAGLICPQCPLVGYTEENPRCMGGKHTVWKILHSAYLELKEASCNDSDAAAAQRVVAGQIRDIAREIARLPIKKQLTK